MLHRVLPLVGLALMTTASAAQQAPSGYSNGCAAVALPYERSMLICNGVPSAGQVAATLRNGAVRGTNLKVIGRSYQLPPWEITGVHSAGSDHRSRYRAADRVVEVGRRAFAVYPRGGTTILIERR